MSDAEIEQKREEDERLDTAEDPNEEVRCASPFANAQALPQTRRLYKASILSATRMRYVYTRNVG
jgi:hypothetical protein